MLDFTIPTSRDDLLSNHSDRYVPRNIVGANELVRKFAECNNALRNEGYKFVLDHFDTLMSLAIHFQRLAWEDVKKGWSIISRAMQTMVNELKDILHPNQELDGEVRKPAANSIKMLVYLLSQLVICFEERVKRIADSTVKRKGSQKTPPEQTEWQEELEETVIYLYDLLHLPLIWLWDPPVPSTEESFYHLISNMAFSVLENPVCTTTKMTKVKETILHILGLMVVRYNYKISIVLRMSDVLNRIDHIAPILALGVKILHDEYNCHSIVREIIKEVLESHCSTVLPQAARNHGSFFAELGELVPSALKEHLPAILPLLEHENVQLRNGILCALSAVVLKCLSHEDMTVADRRQRDELFETMLDHVYDPNAFVRVKALNLWRRLLDESALPQSLRCDVLEASSGRIIDSAASVRKAAIQIVIAFLEHNPASAKMGAAVLEEKLEVEQKKLKTMYEKYREGNPRETQWLEMRASVEIALKEHFEKEESEDVLDGLDTAEHGESDEDTDNKEDTDSNEGEENDKSKQDKNENTVLCSVHAAVCEALEKKKFIKAYKILSTVEHLAPEYMSQNKETGLKGNLNFYVLLIGLFYSYEKLTKDILLKEASESPSENEEVQQLTAQQHYVAYLEDSVNFVKQMENALKLLQKLLSWAIAHTGSGINEGITDAVRLVEVAHAAGVPGAKECMTTVLQLMLYQPEAPVISAIAASAKTVYFHCASSESTSRTERIVVSLMKLLSGLSMGEVQAVEDLMKEWVKNGDISGSFVQVTWDIFLHPERAPEPEDLHDKRLLSLALLRMAAPVLPERVRALVPEIANHVFVMNENNPKNIELASEACVVLSSACPPIQHNHTAPVSTLRLPLDHAIFKELSNMLKVAFWMKESNYFVSLATNAINLAYTFCLSPEPFVEDFLKYMLSGLKEQKRKTLDCILTAENTDTQPSQLSQKGVIPYFTLGRFLAVIGHVAMMQMIFLDTAVYTKIRSLEEKDKIQKSQKKARSKKTLKKTSNARKAINFNSSDIEDMDSASVSTSSGSGTITTACSEEAEESTQAEDRVSESIRQVCENELFRPDRILGQLLPLVVQVVSKRKTYREPNVQRTAVLALSKMMMVSSTVCADNIQLFVTVMENSSDPDTRAMAIIAIADITLRFPNIVEPWSKHIYGRLQDPSEHVRRTTILILSRLVMCDMIKVRGQISDLALCLCDENQTIANAARSFFSELSQKHNVLYNVLPDIISGLFSSDLPEGTFSNITTFIFGLIKKEKQVEVLVDKLCQRFQLVSSDRQAGDLAFCLTLLHYNHKALGRLIDQVQLLSDKLHIEKVYNFFQQIVQKHSKSTVKLEIKTAAEELGTAIEQVVNAQTEDPDHVPVKNTPRSCSRVRATPKKSQGRSSSKTKSVKRKTRRKVTWSSDESLSDIQESPGAS